METKNAPTAYGRKFAQLFIILFVVAIFAGFFLGTVPRILGVMDYESTPVQTARTIELSMYAYASDHNGRYPEGKTSTEVFQQLLDEKYVTDPRLFYTSYGVVDGKEKPRGSQLKPENVCWDVTCCVDQSAPDGLPLVYTTGYKITYQAGARALPAELAASQKTWYQWLFRPPHDRPSHDEWYIAVSYKDNSAKAIIADKDGSIPDFIPADFDPKGKVYRQLTP